MTNTAHKLVALLLGVVLGAGVVSNLGSARAEPQPALDRALVERLVRAQEAQAHAQEAQLRALDAIARAAGRCKP